MLKIKIINTLNHASLQGFSGIVDLFKKAGSKE